MIGERLYGSDKVLRALRLHVSLGANFEKVLDEQVGKALAQICPPMRHPVAPFVQRISSLRPSKAHAISPSVCSEVTKNLNLPVLIGTPGGR